MAAVSITAAILHTYPGIKAVLSILSALLLCAILSRRQFRATKEYLPGVIPALLMRINAHNFIEEISAFCFKVFGPIV